MRNFLLAASAAFCTLALFTQPAAAEVAQTNVDTLTVGAGGFDILPSTKEQQAVDYRIEYRSGLSLLSNYTEPYVAIRPFGGFEGTSDGAAYFLGGFLFDVPLGDHFFITESEGVGVFDSGDGKDMGSFIEFRSQFEGGYKFDNQSRISVAINHISNAGLTLRNHGEESIVGYYSMPIAWLFGADAQKPVVSLDH